MIQHNWERKLELYSETHKTLERKHTIRVVNLMLLKANIVKDATDWS